MDIKCKSWKTVILSQQFFFYQCVKSLKTINNQPTLYSLEQDKIQTFLYSRYKSINNDD